MLDGRRVQLYAPVGLRQMRNTTLYGPQIRNRVCAKKEISKYISTTGVACELHIPLFCHYTDRATSTYPQLMFFLQTPQLPTITSKFPQPVVVSRFLFPIYRVRQRIGRFLSVKKIKVLDIMIQLHL